MATDKPPVDAVHLEAYGGVERLKDVGLHDAALAGGALEGAAQEHSMGVLQALKTYKRAAFWSIRTFLSSPACLHPCLPASQTIPVRYGWIDLLSA
jgi:hypothetical protein